MQAKTSVSDYHESGELSWVRRPAEGVVSQKPKLVILDSKSRQTKLKPGLY